MNWIRSIAADDWLCLGAFVMGGVWLAVCKMRAARHEAEVAEWFATQEHLEGAIKGYVDGD